MPAPAGMDAGTASQLIPGVRPTMAGATLEVEAWQSTGAKVDEVTLALLSLTSFQEHGVTRAWKAHDFDVMNRLHEKGWIENPVGKARSVMLTEAASSNRKPCSSATSVRMIGKGSSSSQRLSRAGRVQ